MVILATRSREIGTNPLLDANCTFDANKDREFSIKIARCNWTEEMIFGNLVYVPDTEFGGIIEDVLTDTTLDYVELKGYTWRGRMAMKVIEPPAGSDYRVVSGELNAILKKLIEPEFGGLYVVSGESTGVAVSNYQFDRYCTLLEGITKMLKTVGYRLDIQHKRERGVPGYILIRAVPIVDYSDEIELSKDSGLNYTMEDKRNGVNHLIVTGKGELNRLPGSGRLHNRSDQRYLYEKAVIGNGIQRIVEKDRNVYCNCCVFFHPGIDWKYNPIKRSCDYVLYL